MHEGSDGASEACHVCELVRARDQHAHGTLSTQTWTRPMQAIGLDHYKVGFKSSEGYTEVLTIVDIASTYVQYIPVRDEKTETTLMTVFTHWIARFGCPEVIFTDLASVFKSSEAQVFYRLLGIDHLVKLFTPAYIQPGPRMTHRVILTWSKHGVKRAEPWVGFGLELDDLITGVQPIEFTTSKAKQGVLTSKSKKLLAGWTPIIQR